MARVRWKDGTVIVLKTHDGHEVVCQMGPDPRFAVFSVSPETLEHQLGNSLETQKPEFTCSIGRIVLQKLFDRKLPKCKPYPGNISDEFFIDSHVVEWEDGIFRGFGGRLVKKPYGTHTKDHKTIISDLDETHLQIIQRFETTYLWGDQDFSERIAGCLTRGWHANPHKENLFPFLLELEKQGKYPVTISDNLMDTLG